MDVEQIFPTKRKKIKVTIIDVGIRLTFILFIISVPLRPLYDWFILIPISLFAIGVFCVVLPMFLDMFVDSLIGTDYCERASILVFERFFGHVLWTVDRSSSDSPPKVKTDE